LPKSLARDKHSSLSVRSVSGEGKKSYNLDPRTDPKDVARVESKTVISTPNKIETIPEPAEGEQGQLGYWMSPEDLDDKIDSLFPGCMRGDTPYFLAMLILKSKHSAVTTYSCKLRL
jgi:GTP-dependent phosphoenolpyruvate carboxykinase